MAKEPRFDSIDAAPAPQGSGSDGCADRPVTVEKLQELLREELARGSALTLLRGFKQDFSGNTDFHKVFFSIRCQCGTAALLSVEVAKSKSLSQVREVLPSLVKHLKSKGQQFSSMSCEMHSRMRGGTPTGG